MIVAADDMLILGRVPGEVEIAYEFRGSGETVVFLHGIGGNRSIWRPQTLAIPNGFRAVAWDARGYGDSDDYDGALAFGDFSDDLARLLDHLECESAHLVGLSMGARILMDFHPRYAERVRTLTLCDCFPSFDASLTPEKREEFVRLRQKPLLEGKSLADMAPVIIDSLVGPNCSDDARQLLADNVLAIHVGSYLKTLEATFQYDRSAGLKDIAQPVCLIFGEHDRLTPPAIGENMQRELPNAEFYLRGTFAYWDYLGTYGENNDQ